MHHCHSTTPFEIKRKVGKKRRYRRKVFKKWNSGYQGRNGDSLPTDRQIGLFKSCPLRSESEHMLHAVAVNCAASMTDYRAMIKCKFAILRCHPKSNERWQKNTATGVRCSRNEPVEDTATVYRRTGRQASLRAAHCAASRSMPGMPQL